MISLWALGLMYTSCETITIDISNVSIAKVYVTDSLRFSGLKFHQSMVFYENQALFVSSDPKRLFCNLFNLNTCGHISTIELPIGDFPAPHANVSCLGNAFYSKESIMPLLYISSWDNQRLLFVYDITCRDEVYNSELVQIIAPNNVSEDIIGGGYLDWVLDNDEGVLYSISYHLKDTSFQEYDNYTHITKFRIPNYNESVVLLDNKDILDSFTLPVMTVFQDKVYSNGHIYVVAGINGYQDRYPPRLFDINLNKHELTQYSIPLIGEPEGFDIYNGEMWLNMGAEEMIYKLSIIQNN